MITCSIRILHTSCEVAHHTTTWTGRKDLEWSQSARQQREQPKLSRLTFPSRCLGLTYDEVVSFVPPPLDQEEMESWAPGFCSVDPTSLWGEGLFTGTLQISFKCLLLQRFPPWWKGVCVRVSVCACVCLSLWEGKTIWTNYDHSDFTWGCGCFRAASTLLFFLRVGSGRQAAVFLGLCSMQSKKIWIVPNPGHAFATLASPVTPTLTVGHRLDNIPQWHKRRPTPSGCFRPDAVPQWCVQPKRTNRLLCTSLWLTCFVWFSDLDRCIWNCKYVCALKGEKKV